MKAETIRAEYSPEALGATEPESLPYIQLELLAEIAAQLAEINERASHPEKQP